MKVILISTLYIIILLYSSCLMAQPEKSNCEKITNINNIIHCSNTTKIDDFNNKIEAINKIIATLTYKNSLQEVVLQRVTNLCNNSCINKDATVDVQLIHTLIQISLESLEYAFCTGYDSVSRQMRHEKLQKTLDSTRKELDTSIRNTKQSIEGSICKIDETIVNMKSTIDVIGKTVSISSIKTDNIEKWVKENNSTTVLLGGSIFSNGGIGVHGAYLFSLDSSSKFELGLDLATLPSLSSLNPNTPLLGLHIGMLINHRILISIRNIISVREFVNINNVNWIDLLTPSLSFKTGTNLFVGGQYSGVTGVGITLLGAL